MQPTFTKAFTKVDIDNVTSHVGHFHLTLYLDKTSLSWIYPGLVEVKTEVQSFPTQGAFNLNLPSYSDLEVNPYSIVRLVLS